MEKWIRGLMMVLAIFFVQNIWAQEDDEWEDEEDFRTEEEKRIDREAAAYWEDEKEEVERKGFYAGLYVGALFSDPYSSRLYDGYGFDRDGQTNTFANSFMNQQINGLYGNPQSQQGDQIAQQLNVGPGEWNFDESDMPVNLTYNIAFSFGLQGRYYFDNKNALLFNINFSQLTVNGQFTINLLTTQPISDPTDPGGINFAEPIQTFGIRGEEQRVGLQLGYQRVLGNHEHFNWVFEAGVDLTFAKFDGNQAEINNLVIDLTTFYNRFGAQTEAARNLTGVSAGAFAGFGPQLETGGKWTIQLLYNPVFQKIALGNDTQYGIHHMVGFRAIYNI